MALHEVAVMADEDGVVGTPATEPALTILQDVGKLVQAELVDALQPVRFTAGQHPGDGRILCEAFLERALEALVAEDDLRAAAGEAGIRPADDAEEGAVVRDAMLPVQTGEKIAGVVLMRKEFHV